MKDTGGVTTASPQGFEVWFEALIASAEDPADTEGRTLGTMRPGFRRLLETLFQVHGPVTREELDEALAADGALEVLRLQACDELLPIVLRDAAAWGVADLEVRVAAGREG